MQPVQRVVNRWVLATVIVRSVLTGCPWCSFRVIDGEIYSIVSRIFLETAIIVFRDSMERIWVIDAAVIRTLVFVNTLLGVLGNRFIVRQLIETDTIPPLSHVLFDSDAALSIYPYLCRFFPAQVVYRSFFRDIAKRSPWITADQRLSGRNPPCESSLDGRGRKLKSVAHRRDACCPEKSRRGAWMQLTAGLSAFPCNYHWNYRAFNAFIYNRYKNCNDRLSSVSSDIRRSESTYFKRNYLFPRSPRIFGAFKISIIARWNDRNQSSRRWF